MGSAKSVTMSGAGVAYILESAVEQNVGRHLDGVDPMALFVDYV